MIKDIQILEFPSNLGLKEREAGKEPGVRRLPAWLNKYGFYDMFEPQNIHSLSPPQYTMDLDEESGVRNADAIAKYAKQQSELFLKVLGEKVFPFIIGGDCSILIGNAIALKQTGECALFFLDGHTDFMRPELSQTGGAAGMDLAIVTGYGHQKLTNINDLKPYFKEENVWCVGNREYDEQYVSPILNSNINYYDINFLRKDGIGKCVDDFLEMVHNNNLDGFFIHFDVDVLNDDIMPAVDSRAEGGLSYNELNLILKKLLHNEKAAGLQITVLDPDLDPSARYTKDFILNVGRTIKDLRKQPQV